MAKTLHINGRNDPAGHLHPVTPEVTGPNEIVPDPSLPVTPKLQKAAILTACKPQFSSSKLCLHQLLNPGWLPASCLCSFVLQEQPLSHGLES